MARKTKRPTIQVKPGDHVLVGMPGVSMPGDWHIGTVLWVGDGGVLVKQHGLGGNDPHRMLHGIDYIRAVGSIEALADYRRRSFEAVREAQKHVRECESALGRARDAVWVKLDEIAVQPGQPETEAAS